jgi:hypothetical protein
MIFFGEEKMKTREYKRMVKLGFFLNKKNRPFGVYIKNIICYAIHSLFGA